MFWGPWTKPVARNYALRTPCQFRLEPRTFVFARALWAIGISYNCGPLPPLGHWWWVGGTATFLSGGVWRVWNTPPPHK